MTDFHFNLVTEPWLPCVTSDGKPCEIGIQEALANAHRYRELYDTSPLVTVALHRLLLTILYRCWSPQDEEAWDELWQQLWEAKQFPPDAITAYLNHHQDAFDLFSENAPFYQTAHLVVGKQEKTKNGQVQFLGQESGLSRLATEAACGNNATLFDHSQDDVEVVHSPATAARILAAAQAYALGFGKSSAAKIGELVVSPPYTKDAPLLRGLTVWLSGETLFETLLLNLIPHFPTGDDQPLWERQEPYRLIFQNDGTPKKQTPAQGLLDRYTWQSRLIRLLPELEDGKTVVKQMYFTQGRSVEKDDQEPMKAYRRDKTQGMLPVALSASKAAWRDSQTLFAIGGPEGGAKRPEMFNHVASWVRQGVVSPKYECAAHVVGLATAPNKAAKLLLWRHERLPIPARLLGDTDLIGQIALLIEEAEDIAREMRRRFWIICDRFVPDTHKPDKDEATRLADGLDPRRTYWPCLEHHFHLLLHQLPEDETRAKEQWRGAVEKEANTAFQDASRLLGVSVRALRATATVSDRFKIPRIGVADEEMSGENTSLSETREEIGA